MVVANRPTIYELKPLEVVAAVAAVGVALTGDQPLVDAVVVLGLGIIAPLALGRSRLWPVAAIAASVGLQVDSDSIATLLVLPALVAAAWSLSTVLRRTSIVSAGSLRDRVRSGEEITALLAATWGIVAVMSLMVSTAGLELFGIGEPIVRLTAVHYLYAGVGALTIARRLRLEPTAPAWLPTLAVASTGAAPPIVAAGFVLGHPLPQIGGAVLMTVGVWSSAAAMLVGARRTPEVWRLACRVVAGLTPWAPMVLAVAWASAQHIAGVPALSVPDMARVHGLANGVGFTLLGLLATTPSTPTNAGRRLVGTAR